MKSNILFVLVIMSLLLAPWVINGIKFTKCDFKSDYKCEAIHGAGVVVPPLAWITVWFKSDED